MLAPRKALGRRVVAALALLLTVAAALPARAASAPAAPTPTPTYGNDVSWPQCSKAQGGYGLPMPPATAGFVVVGITKGLPFTDNPCLSDQVAWAASRAVPTQAYTFAAFPTSAQLAQYGGAGPWGAGTRWGRLADVGYAQGTWAVGRLRAVGLAARVVWVDIEPRTAQPWPTGSRSREAENRAVITGLARALDDAGYAYGFYSNTSGWKTITGGWWAPGTPAWATVGQKTSTEAAAACARAGVSGGPVHLAQWFDATRDSDLTCPAYTARPAVPYPVPDARGAVPRANDLDGDWSDEIVTRDAAGALWSYPTGRPRRQIGQGWAGMDLLDTVGDLSGDGVPDLVARDGAGVLWLYPRTASGGWLARRSVGPGWERMSAVLGAGDLSGDGRPDVLARDAETNRLWLYAGDGRGALAEGVQVGVGWDIADVLLGPGDVDGDGVPDVLARTAADGALWLYPGNGTGGWLAPRRVGVGWAGFDLLAAPGDVTGDGAPDVVARDRRTGRVWVYPTDGRGGWRARVDRGTAAAGANLIA